MTLYVRRLINFALILLLNSSLASGASVQFNGKDESEVISGAITEDTADVPEQSSEPAATETMEPPVKESPPTEPQVPEKAATTSYKGTLEIFRAYQGEKTPAILIALFNKKIAPAIRQEPAVAASDGKTQVKIVVELEGAGDRAPNFALNGAKLLSLNKEDASFNWIIETLPQIGILQASLTILIDNNIIEYPLTLAPPADGVSPAETDFAIFLNDNGANPPKRDLNGDGKHDYLDDYIYTAHYLIKKSEGNKEKK